MLRARDFNHYHVYVLKIDFRLPSFFGRALLGDSVCLGKSPPILSKFGRFLVENLFYQLVVLFFSFWSIFYRKLPDFLIPLNHGSKKFKITFYF